MPRLEAPSLTVASYVLEFSQPVQKIRFEQARAEDAFASLVNSQSEQTNVPDAEDPNIPRIVFNSGKKSILISQIRCQMDFKFDGSGEDMEKRLAVVRKHAAAFHSAAAAKFAVVPFGLNAAILTVHVGSKDEPQALHEHIYQQFIKVRSPLPIASAQVAIGFRKDDFFVNLAAEVYETRRFSFVGQSGTPVFVKHSNAELIDSGIQVRVDVNNRPASEKDTYSLPESTAPIFETLDTFLRDHFDDFTGMSLK